VVKLDEIGAAELDRLEPLWLLLHAHHQAVAPELAPYVDDAASWPVRRALYADTLAAGGFALVAHEEGTDLGYALVGSEVTHWSATFVTAVSLDELVTLVVRPDARDKGVGSALLDAAEARLDAAGSVDRVIGVVPANVRAIELYRRRGFAPTWLTMTRFRRPPQVDAGAGAAVEPVAVGEVDALEALWLELHHHHQAVAPHLGPYIPDAKSWEIVRDLFREAAERDHIVRVGPSHAPSAMAYYDVTRDDPLWADTWQTGRDVADLKMLVVASDARGRGLGSAVMDAIDARLAAAGVSDQVIGAIEPNRDAIRLYERRGFRPAWLQMTRFASRDAGR
jgi:ribosomal protein S18 acetylase RimI-like enzyme